MAYYDTRLNIVICSLKIQKYLLHSNPNKKEVTTMTTIPCFRGKLEEIMKDKNMDLVKIIEQKVNLRGVIRGDYLLRDNQYIFKVTMKIKIDFPNPDEEITNTHDVFARIIIIHFVKEDYQTDKKKIEVNMKKICKTSEYDEYEFKKFMFACKRAGI